MILHTPLASTVGADDNTEQHSSLLLVDKFKSFPFNLSYKHMVNASSCTVEPGKEVDQWPSPIPKKASLVSTNDH